MGHSDCECEVCEEMWERWVAGRLNAAKEDDDEAA